MSTPPPEARGHRDQRELLGAYALGHLPDAEVSRVRSHLDGCAGCRAELAEIAPVVGLLRDLDPAVFDEPALEPGPLLAARIERQVRRERSARRRRLAVRRGLVGAAAAVVLLASGTGGYLLGRPDPAPAVVAVPMEAVTVTSRAPGVNASADLVDHTWGIEIKLTATGLVAGEGYEMSVLDSQGRRHDAGGMVGTGGRTIHCNLGSDVLRGDATSFTLTDAAGDVVLTAGI